MKRSTTFPKVLFLSAILYANTHPVAMENVCTEYVKLGDSLRQENQLEKALTYYRNAIQIDDNNSAALFGMGTCFLQLEQYDKAIEHYKRLLTYAPNSVSVRINLGHCLIKTEQTRQAIEVFQEILELQPDHLGALKQLARLLKEKKEYASAITYLERASEIAPHDAHTLYLLGKTFEASDQYSRAVDYYKEVLNLAPDHLLATVKIANLCNLLDRLDEAIEHYEKVLMIKPDDKRVKYNYANTLKKLERLEEALELYEELALFHPDYVSGRFGRALCYLARGDFKRGWPEYEWRWAAYKESPKKFSVPVWDGSDVDGKTILLYAEQGLGDTFQFIRYAKILKEMGATVIFQSQSPAADLLKQCNYIDHVIPRGQPLPFFDTHIALMSLPMIFESNEQTIPHDIPYLFAKEDLVNLWKEKLAQRESQRGQTGAFRIGICWQGNPSYRTQVLRHTVAAKSIQLEQFAQIANLPGVVVYSLQKMSGEDQIEEAKDLFDLQTFGPELDTVHGRFMDTAAIMKNLDLVITVDTSIAHVAGGLGVPTWLMLPNPSDWRWPVGWNYTPWYPEIKLFKQPQPGDWDSVIETLITQLLPLLSHQNKKPEPTEIINFEDLLDQITLLKLQAETSDNPEIIEHKRNNLEHKIEQLEKQYEHILVPQELDQLAQRLTNANKFLLENEKELEEAQDCHKHIVQLKENIKNEIRDLVNAPQN